MRYRYLSEESQLCSSTAPRAVAIGKLTVQTKVLTQAPRRPGCRSGPPNSNAPSSRDTQKVRSIVRTESMGCVLALFSAAKEGKV